MGGENKQCYWNTPVLDYTLYGNAYVEGNKFRIEAQVGSLIFGVKGYVVGDGETITAWSNLEPDIKQTLSYEEARQRFIQLAAEPTPFPSYNPRSAPPADIDYSLPKILQNQKFYCRSWQPDQSKFTIPTLRPSPTE